MQNTPAKYIHLQSDDPLPDISNLQPFKAIVVIEDRVSQIWQWQKVSRWLVTSGCRYMMAWGPDCSSWDDSVDEANLEAFNYGDIPDSYRIMTTWHEDEELSEVFSFSKHKAHHPCHEMQNTVILHISKEDKRRSFEEQYANA